MRILMLLENDFSDDVRVAREIESLHKSGYTISVAAITRKRNAGVEVRDNCTVYRKSISSFIHKSSVGALRLPFYFNFWRSFTTEVLSREQVDILHVHDLPLAAVGVEIKKKTGVRLVMDMHENYPALLEISKHTGTLLGKLLSGTAEWRKYETEQLNKADGVIAVVEEMKKRLVLTGIDEHKIAVVENTSQLPLIFKTPEQFNSDTLRLVYVGGLTYHRGLQYVLKGLSLLNGTVPVTLTIAGDGSYRSVLEKITFDSGLTDKVLFKGKISRNEINELLNSSDLALIPHLRSEQGDNSSPNKLYEYMSSGIPVMASDCISVKRIVDETGCGVTYTYDSPADIANTIAGLMREKDRLLQFSKNGISAAQKKYNWTETEKNLLALYSSLNESRG